MSKNYPNFADQIIIPYLEKLIDFITDAKRNSILRVNWKQHTIQYANAYLADSDEVFMKHLFGKVGGLKKLFEKATKVQVQKTLTTIFNISAQCYFDYSCKEEVEALLKNFCDKSDKWMEQTTLTKRFAIFKKCKDVVPIIHETLIDTASHIENPELITDSSAYRALYNQRDNIDNADIKDLQDTISRVFDILVIAATHNPSEHSTTRYLFKKFCKNLDQHGITLTKKKLAEFDDVEKRIRLWEKINTSIVLFHIKKEALIHSNSIQSSQKVSIIEKRAGAMLADMALKSLRKNPTRKSYHRTMTLSSLWENTIFSDAEAKEIKSLKPFSAHFPKVEVILKGIIAIGLLVIFSIIISVAIKG
jgi:hypothetical protein